MFSFASDTEFVQSAWAYANDSLRTNLCIRFKASQVACACVHLASRFLERGGEGGKGEKGSSSSKVPSMNLPKDWFVLFDVTSLDLKLMCESVLALYVMCPPGGGGRGLCIWVMVKTKGATVGMGTGKRKTKIKKKKSENETPSRRSAYAFGRRRIREEIGLILIMAGPGIHVIFPRAEGTTLLALEGTNRGTNTNANHGRAAATGGGVIRGTGKGSRGNFKFIHRKPRHTTTRTHHTTPGPRCLPT